MKRIILSLSLVLSLLSITGCSENIADEIIVAEKPANIENIFEKISEKFKQTSVEQSTAFSWTIKGKNMLLNGFRLKIVDSSITSTDISDFFDSESFQKNTENSSNDDNSWSLGYTNSELNCLLQGRNGNSEENTRDVIVNCAENDSKI